MQILMSTSLTAQIQRLCTAASLGDYNEFTKLKAAPLFVALTALNWIHNWGLRTYCVSHIYMVACVCGQMIVLHVRSEKRGG